MRIVNVDQFGIVTIELDAEACAMIAEELSTSAAGGGSPEYYMLLMGYAGAFQGAALAGEQAQKTLELTEKLRAARTTIRIMDEQRGQWGVKGE